MGSLLLADALALPCSLGASFPSSRAAAAAAAPCLALSWAAASPYSGRAPLFVRSSSAFPSPSSSPLAPPRQMVGVGRGSALLTSNSAPSHNGVYTVGDFMTKRGDLLVVTPTTTVDQALELLAGSRITGFPVIDDDWKLVGVVSDYDLLALDSISGSRQNDTDLFPEVDSTWKTFNEIQKLLGKTHGKVIGDLMTLAPLVVRETTNIEDAARLLLQTKYRRLPVVDADGKLVGIITRGNVVRAALQIKRAIEKRTLS